MSNQNSYPDLSNQPLLNNQAPPPPPPQNPYNNNYNNQGYPAVNQAPYNQGFQPNNQGFQPNNQGFIPNNNQGFIPNNNQGFVPNNQGFMPSLGKLMCPFCARQTDSFPKKTPGGVTYIWCVVLFIITGVCCCVPFCVDSCLDTDMICVICQRPKARIQANCC